MSDSDPVQTPGPVIEVPKPLSPGEVCSFVEQGFIAVPNLVTPEEVDEMRADTIRLARGEYPCKAIPPVPPGRTDAEVLSTVLCIHQPHFVSPVMEKYVRHPAVCGVLSQVTAAHLPWWDGSVKCMQSMLFVKPPEFQGQAWHQDEIYIPTRDRSLIGAWIALDDATVENGCLWVIPGSNKTGYLYPQHAHGDPDEFDTGDQSYGFDTTTEAPVEVEAGTVVFFNGYLLHRSARNRSSIYRRVLVNHYCNAWSLLPWSIAEGESVASADRRCVLPVSGSDPYAWKGYVPAPDSVWLRTCKTRDELVSSSVSE